MARREFTKADKVAMVKRATRNSVVYCEGCGLPAKRWQFDHTIAEAFVVDKSRKLTSDDGQLLCSGTPGSCHDRKTAKEDQPNISRAKRREAIHIGADAPKGSIKSGPSMNKARRETPVETANGVSNIYRRFIAQ